MDPEPGQLSLGQTHTLKNSTADASHMARLWGQEDAHQCLHLLVLEVGRDSMRENPEQDSGGWDGQREGQMCVNEFCSMLASVTDPCVRQLALEVVGPSK